MFPTSCVWSAKRVGSSFTQQPCSYTDSSKWFLPARITHASCYRSFSGIEERKIAKARRTEATRGTRGKHSLLLIRSQGLADVRREKHRPCPLMGQETSCKTHPFTLRAGGRQSAPTSSLQGCRRMGQGKGATQTLTLWSMPWNSSNSKSQGLAPRRHGPCKTQGPGAKEGYGIGLHSRWRTGATLLFPMCAHTFCPQSQQRPSLIHAD